MLVKFLNSDGTVSTAIAGSYFQGPAGATGADGADAVYPVFDTQAEAEAYSAANPNQIVGWRD